MIGTAFIALVLLFPILFGLLLTLIINLIRKLRHKNRLPLPISSAICVLSAATVCICACTFWSSRYYPAEESALTYLESSDTVTVTHENGVYFFDSPSEDTAMIFYPGALVQPEAYAPLLRKIADNGVDVFLAEMPFRFAFLGVNEADGITDTHSYDHLYMCGHSIGGCMASYYCARSSANISGIIFLASFPATKLDDDLGALSIYGSEDSVLSMKSYEKHRINFNDNSSELVIEGGNHAQFGAYGEQRRDGTASISSEKQQRITVDAITDFIRASGSAA